MSYTVFKKLIHMCLLLAFFLLSILGLKPLQIFFFIFLFLWYTHRIVSVRPTSSNPLLVAHHSVHSWTRRRTEDAVQCIKSSCCLSYFSELLWVPTTFRKLVSRKRRWKQFMEAIVGLLTIFCRWNTLTYKKLLHRHLTSSIKMFKINLQLGTSKFFKKC